MNKIDSFKDEYFFLSNFYEAPVEYDGLKYGSSEAAFQAQKCEFFSKRKEGDFSPSSLIRRPRSRHLRAGHSLK